MIGALKNKIAMSMVRHALSGAGLVLVNEGLTDKSQVEQAVGAVMVLIGFGASILKARRERRDEQVIATASSLHAPPG